MQEEGQVDPVAVAPVVRTSAALHDRSERGN